MKRLIPATITFLLIICIIVYSTTYIKRECKKTSEEIKACYTAFLNGNTENASILAKKLTDDWHERHIKLSMFVYHSFLDDLTLYIEEIPLYVELQLDDKFYAACKKADTVLEQIVHETKFKISCFY